jgi:hypothetical protein
MSGLTTKQLSKIYLKSPETIYKVLRKHCYYSSGTHKNKQYDESVTRFLDRYYGLVPETQIEVIKVPVYVNIHWAIYESKINKK